MLFGKPAPFVSAFVAAVDDAMRAHQPHGGMSARQRAWLAFCVTAVLVTNSICWARFERASLGTYSLAALSWMFRHSKMPWDHLLVASVRVILRYHGITAGSLVIDDTDNQRSKSAKALAHLYKLRDKESGGYIWGQSLVFLVLVTPKISIPVGFVFYQPAPELSAWYKQLESGEFYVWLKLNTRGHPRTLWLPTERVHRKGYPLAQAHCTPCAQALGLCLWLTPPPFQATMAACHPYGRCADCVGHTP
jgi:hypothetical protein